MSGGPIRVTDAAARKVRAADVMSTPVLAVTVDATLERAGEVLARNGFTTLPVVDEYGRLCGLITEEALAGAHLARLSVYADLPEPIVSAIRRPLTVRAVALPPVALDADAGTVRHRASDAADAAAVRAGGARRPADRNRQLAQYPSPARALKTGKRSASH